MREKEIREKLIVDVEEIINEMKSKVTVGGEVRKYFWIAKEVRQGCPLSAMLFNILIVSVEKVMGKVK